MSLREVRGLKVSNRVLNGVLEMLLRVYQASDLVFVSPIIVQKWELVPLIFVKLSLRHIL